MCTGVCSLLGSICSLHELKMLADFLADNKVLNVVQICVSITNLPFCIVACMYFFITLNDLYAS